MVMRPLAVLSLLLAPALFSKCNDHVNDILRGWNANGASADTHSIDGLKNKLKKWEDRSAFPVPAVEVSREVRIGKLLHDLAENPYVAVSNIEPIFTEMQLNYHVLLREEASLKALQRAVENRETRAIQEALSHLDGVNVAKAELEQLRDRAAAKDSAGMQIAFAAVANAVEGDMNQRTKSLAANFDEYEAMAGLLEKLAGNKKSPLKDAAQLVLDRTQSQFLLKSFFDRIHARDRSTPSLHDLHEAIRRHPQGEIDLLKSRVSAQFWGALRSWSPTNHALQVVDKIASTNRITNVPEVHYFLQLLQDPYYRYAHASSIVEVFKAGHDRKLQLETFKMNNLRFPNNEMMVTLARLVDNQSKSTWEALKKEASDENDKDLLSQMNEAEKQAKNQGPLLPMWAPGADFRIVRSGMDALATVGIPYLVTLAVKRFHRKKKEDGTFFALEDGTEHTEAVALEDRLNTLMELALKDPEFATLASGT